MNQNDIIELLEKKISLNKKTSTSLEYSQFFRKGKWTQVEDENLRYYLSIFGERNWKKISEHMEGRSSIQCLHRWTKILKPGLIKGPWTLEEDKKLNEWVQLEGASKWSKAASYIPGRSGKQCRERWLNNLSPNLKKSSWNDEEDELIFALYKKYGSAWSKIAKHFNGRTENSIKNRFYSTIRRLALDRSRQSTALDSLTIKTEEDRESMVNPILEKIQAKKHKIDSLKAEGINSSGEVQSILQELTYNYRNFERKEVEVKKEYMEELKIGVKEEEAKDFVSDHNISKSLLAFEKSFSSIRNDGFDIYEKKSQGLCGLDMKVTENNLNEIFNDFLIEEQMIDQSILQLIRGIKNIECLLMDKTKENLEKEMSLKQEQLELKNSQEANLKRKFYNLEDNDWVDVINSKKMKVI